MNLLSTKGVLIPAQKLTLPIAQLLQSIKVDIKVNSRNTGNKVIDDSDPDKISCSSYLPSNDFTLSVGFIC